MLRLLAALATTLGLILPALAQTGEQREAAEQEHAEAQYNLGAQYYQGRGVEQDHTVAAHWFRRAAEHGLAQAQYSLGLLWQLYS